MLSRFFGVPLVNRSKWSILTALFLLVSAGFLWFRFDRDPTSGPVIGTHLSLPQSPDSIVNVSDERVGNQSNDGKETANDGETLGLEPTFSSLLGDVLASVEWKDRSRPRNVDALYALDLNVDEVLARVRDESDTWAALTVARWKQHCAMGPKTQEALDEAKHRIQTSRVLGVDPTNGAENFIDDNNLEAHLQKMDTVFAICGRLRSATAGKDRNYYLQFASDRGNTSAQIEYGVFLVAAKPERAYGLFEQAWSQGDFKALFRMSQIAMADYQSGKDPSALLRAAALKVAHTALSETEYLNRGISAESMFLKSLSFDSRDLLDSLLPTERESVIQQAQEIIASNSACCLINDF